MKLNAKSNQEWDGRTDRAKAIVAGAIAIIYNQPPLRVLSHFLGGVIAYLIDSDRYAGWSFYTPVRASQVRQIEG